MLAELRIHNLLLIADVKAEFDSGLNALTGETGAGKSLLVDALGFLLGERGEAELIRQGEAQAEVSARFLLAEKELVDFCASELGLAFDDAGLPAELVLTRHLPRSGRPRAYANSRPIALPALKELAARLLDVHGQHENQSLLRPATRLEILDRYAEAGAERAAVRQAHGTAQEAAAALSTLRRAARDRQGREDLLRFQLKELTEARLDDLEPERLEGEVRLLRDAEKVRAAALEACAALDGDDDHSAATLLARSAHSFAALGNAGPEVTGLAERLQGLLAELRAASQDAAQLAEKAKSDPERLADLDERRHRLHALERKHGRDLEGLRELARKLKTDLSDLEQLEVRTEEREGQLDAALEQLRHACEALTRKRKAAARELEKRVNRELEDLGLKNAKLGAVLVPHAAAAASSSPGENFPSEPDAEEAPSLLPEQFKVTGAEGMELLFAGNPDLPARPLKECASGGEISRVMLALKGVLARLGGADRLPVVVFDEIDAGVGGRLGSVLGKKLRELAKVRQVLCVTHQPQIAACAQRQLRVEKNIKGTATTINLENVEGGRRVEELAQMLRGASASANTRKEAAAMLREGQQ